MYAVGSRVRIRGEHWLVRDARLVQHDVYAVHVRGLSETVRDYEATFLDSLDEVEVLDPKDVKFVPDTSEGYRRSKLFLHSLLARTPITRPGVTTRGQAAIEESDYQYLPAQRALSLVRPRLLIADGVGLGKTIEAGILMSELIRRGRGRRILVVAMRSTLEQIQKELWARFSIPLMRLDSIGIERIRREIPRNKNPFHYYDRIIISIDTLKNDERYHRFLEGCFWDIVWIDECHNAANSTTARNQLATLLADNSHSLILTSATPHNGKPESFAGLMRMLDPTSVVDPESLRKEDIEHMVVRRFKADVIDETPGFHQVHDEKLVCETSAEEDQVFTKLGGFVAHEVESSNVKIDHLFSVTALKSFLSSPEALQDTLRNRLSRIERRIEQLTAQGKAEALSALQADVRRLQDVAQSVLDFNIRETAKYRTLLEVLRGWACSGDERSPRVVVFSERIDTLKALHGALEQDLSCRSEAIREFTAQMPDVDQEAVVREFNEEDSPIRILLASDVASEGVNLHHRCHHMVHYDIPWSFIRLQQRNGRIDRFGQTKTPEIRYLQIHSTVHEADTRIVSRLIDKAQSIERTLGDPASALKILVAEEEEEFLMTGMAEGKPVDELIPDFSTDFSDLFMPKTEPEPIETLEAPQLYNSWITLVKDLQGELADERAEYRQRMGMEDVRRAGERIDVMAEQSVVSISGVEDLKARLRSLPPDVMRRGEVRLTTDIQRVLARIQRATDEGDWSAEDLLWDVHPVADWMLDRASAFFAGQSAPDIVLPHLGKGDRHYIVQGLISTKSGYPAHTEWVLASFVNGSWTARPFVGLGDPLLARPWVNPGKPGTEGPDKNATEVLRLAGQHVTESAQATLSDLRKKVERELDRVENWYASTLTGTNSRSSGATAPQRARLARQQLQHTQTYEHTKSALESLLEVEPQPLLRICARIQGV